MRRRGIRTGPFATYQVDICQNPLKVMGFLPLCHILAILPVGLFLERGGWGSKFLSEHERIRLPRVSPFLFMGACLHNIEQVRVLSEDMEMGHVEWSEREIESSASDALGQRVRVAICTTRVRFLVQVIINF